MIPSWGGRFDGIIGVLAGIEIAQCLAEQGIRWEHPFEVIDFLSEESSDYGISCVGSRAFSGSLDAAMLDSQNSVGETLAEAISRIGGTPAELTQPLRKPQSIAAFIELHIEQGPVLESLDYPIGVVTNIVGIRRVRIVVTGQPDHAGTTPMDIRRDALVGAARIIDEAYRMASQMSGNPSYVVATVGHLEMTPNVANAVPGHVALTLEVRSDNQVILDTFPEQLLATVASGLTALRLSTQVTHLTRAKPTPCSDVVMEAIELAANKLDYANIRLPSGAGHDAVYVSPLGPTGMVFIPCLNGRSHCPEEWIESQQLWRGTQVLYQALTELDGILISPERSLLSSG
ncbi:hydantoinase/carbamoylase family amidase [Scandinavium sp. M-37]|uniref:hydantoinase/carbamoylase family amidase n=1 Tax=Scandinavium sp. M-37 TaxID=3373077 RepID=UPI0037452779